MCPGTVFENVVVRGAKTAGVRLDSVSGENGAPVTFDRLRVVQLPNTDGVHISAAEKLESKRIAIKNSRFEGPGRAGIRFDGPALDLEVSNNRFYNLSAGVSFAKPGGLCSLST